MSTKALPRVAATPTAQAAPRPTVVPLSTAMAKRSTKVDELFNDFISDDSPGAAVMVIRKGKVVHSAGYGLANLEEGEPITSSNLFHIASIGKSFTALGIMMLAEEGLLDYDEPVGEYLPELSWMGKGVTIRRLLYHTSGITNYNNDPTMADEMLELSDTPGNAELLAVLSIEHDLDYRPGNKYDYSNTGYDVLGLVIERLSGQSYADFIQERIFDPLGMSHSFVIPNPKKRAGPLVAMSYADEDEDGKPEAYPSDPWDNLSGSGAIFSSVEDMFYYDQALYTDELVSQETLEEAFTSGTINNGNETDYGFAWEIGEYNDEWYVSHSGYWLAFDSYFLRFPDAELSIIVLYNWDYAEPDAGEAAFEIADIYQ
jgi:CubicO group peptidase (beta-lactamase class C family)